MWLKLLSLVSGFTNVLLVQEFYLESSLILLNKKKLTLKMKLNYFFTLKKIILLLNAKEKKFIASFSSYNLRKLQNFDILVTFLK